MIRSRLRSAVLLGGVLGLAGCAGVEGPAGPVEYSCAEGKSFAVRYAASGETAEIDIDRMRFALRKETVDGQARYVCDMLTLFMDAGGMRVDVQGERARWNCQPVPVAR